MNWLINWVSANATVFAWLSAASIFLLCLTLFITPWLVAQLPRDYFITHTSAQNRGSEEITAHSDEQTPTKGSFAKSVWLGVVKVLRNILGVTLMLCGLLLMITPGPGLAMLVLGLSVCDFSAKQRLLLQTVHQPRVFSALNWMRQRHGKPAFLLVPD